MLKRVLMMGACALVVSFQAFAGEADEKWIAKCVGDNADQGQTNAVLQKYCSCMNYKMDEDETRSVTEWEKTHESEAIACENEAGWVEKK